MVPKDAGPAVALGGHSPAASASVFRAFISYSHRDTKPAEWLHRAIETYRIPKSIVGRVTSTGPIGKRPGKVFRDRDELEVAADLSGKINEALLQSQFLIVLCSPESARSRWVNQEIINFKRLKGPERIIAVIVAGEPGASAIQGREGDECFAPALRFNVSSDGLLTDEPTEPIAADLRPGKDPKRRVKIKVIAGLLGVGLDELIRRENARRQRLTAYGMVASLAGMAVMSALAWSAMVARDDSARRGRKAEEMMEFLLGTMQVPMREAANVKEYDEAVERTVGYYADEDVSKLSSESLGRYGRALHLKAEARWRAGRIDEALDAATSAREMTGAALLQDPNDPNRISDHGQSEFWIANLNYDRGDVQAAIEHLAAYAQLADRAAAAGPSQPRRANAARAHGSLATALARSGDLDRSAAEFETSRAIWARLAKEYPNDDQVKVSSASIMSLASAVVRDQGRMHEALSMQRDALIIVEAVYAKNKNDREPKSLLARFHRRMGGLLFESGDDRLSIDHFESAQALALDLLKNDRQNSGWQDLFAQATTDLAAAALWAGNAERAARELAGEDLTAILARPAKAGAFTTRVQVQIAARAIEARIPAGRPQAERLALAQRNVNELAAIPGSADASLLAAEAELLLGDMLDRAGNTEGAAEHWRAAEGVSGRRLGVRADYIGMQALCRAGDLSSAMKIADRLRGLGYAAYLSAAVEERCKK